MSRQHHGGPGRRSVLSLAILAAMVMGLAPAALAQSPSPSSAPADDAFPWPVLPSPHALPMPPPFEPTGPPDASTTRHGIRLDLWLSTSSAAPGEWVQAVVRTTNLEAVPAWSWPGECLTSGTWVSVDVSPVLPPGEEQTGNAAVLKRRAVSRSRGLYGGFGRWEHLERNASQGTTSRESRWTYVECPVGPRPLRLKPRATLEERFAWYTASALDDAWFRPLPPGTVTITASWPFLSRVKPPQGRSWRAPRDVNAITTATTLELTGDGPGTPSVPELIDIALEDPGFRAWVDEDPTRASWAGISLTGWPGPTYERNLLLIGLEDAPTTGVVTLELERGPSLRGVISLDPWTGEVLRTHCIGPTLARPCTEPTPLGE